MRYLKLLFVISMLHFSSNVNSQQRPFAVIELFTSQGCSSCPAADQLLNDILTSDTNQSLDIYALSFHVDYWNRLGWTDTYSNPLYSERQNSYTEHWGQNSVYTPQMIVNGEHQFTGSDKNALKKALDSAGLLKPEKIFKTIRAKQSVTGDIEVNFQLYATAEASEIRFVLISRKTTTTVKRGENSGRKLVSSNVVRQFISVPFSDSGSIKFNAITGETKSNLAVVAFIQQSGDYKIIGASMADVE